MISQKYIILFILTAAAAVIILSALFFVFYKKDDDKKDDDKTTVKISESGIYIPDLPTTETYFQRTIYPCDEFENQDSKEGEEFIGTIRKDELLSDKEKEDSLIIQKTWCKDLGIPIGKGVEVVGYSSDPSIDLDETGYVDIYKPDKDTGCLYGEDKKRCVYVQKKDENGLTIGIENYLGESFLNNYWNGLEKNSKMKGMYKKEFDDYYEFKIEKGVLSIRQKATSKNCKKLTGEWWNLKPGINVPLIMSLQLTVTYLNLMGYKKEDVIFDMKLKTLSGEKIRENVANEMKISMKGEDTDGPDMCTDDIIYEPENVSPPPVLPSSGREGVVGE